MVRFVTNLFEKLQKKHLKNPRFNYRANRRDDEMIETFLNKMGDIDEQFLEKFITFQFSIYSSLDTKFKKNIMLNWLVGEKAIKRWKNRKDGANFIVSKIIKEGRVESSKEVYSKTILTTDYKDSIRRGTIINYNNFIRCFELELFESGNEFCEKCKIKEECQE